MKKLICLIAVVAATLVGGTKVQAEITPSEGAEIVHSEKTNNIEWAIDSNGVFTMTGCGKWKQANWLDYANEVRIARVDVTCDEWFPAFEDFTNLISIDFTGSDLSSVTTTMNCFAGCTNLETIEWGNSEFGDKLTNVSGMFSGCKKLSTTVKLSSAITDYSYCTYNVGIESAGDGLTIDYDGVNCTKELARKIANSGYINNGTHEGAHLITDIKLTEKDITYKNVYTVSEMKRMSLIDVYYGNKVLSTKPHFFNDCSSDAIVPGTYTMNWKFNSGFVGMDRLDDCFYGSFPITITVVADPDDDDDDTYVDDDDHEKTSETPSSETKPTETETTENPKQISKFSKGKFSYKVITGNTVSVTGITKAAKTSKTLSIPATVSYNGKNYKVTAIAAKAFTKNTKVTKVTIGKNVKKIEANAFSGCRKLTTVTLGNGVTSIGNSAFLNCVALKKITIPSKVTTISAKAFKGCSKLNTVTIKSTKLKSVSSNAFKGISKKATFKVPINKVKAYKKFFKGYNVTK